MTDRSTESKGIASLLKNLAQDSFVNCPIGKLAQIDSESASILDELLTSDKVSVRKIYEAIRTEKLRIGKDSMQAHRNKKCSCFNAR